MECYPLILDVSGLEYLWFCQEIFVELLTCVVRVALVIDAGCCRWALWVSGFGYGMVEGLICDEALQIWSLRNLSI